VGTLRNRRDCHGTDETEVPMNQIIYIVGLIVVVVAVLSFFGLR
jgi:hypothetical protein